MSDEMKTGGAGKDQLGGLGLSRKTTAFVELGLYQRFR